MRRARQGSDYTISRFLHVCNSFAFVLSFGYIFQHELCFVGEQDPSKHAEAADYAPSLLNNYPGFLVNAEYRGNVRISVYTCSSVERYDEPCRWSGSTCRSYCGTCNLVWWSGKSTLCRAAPKAIQSITAVFVIAINIKETDLLLEEDPSRYGNPSSGSGEMLLGTAHHVAPCLLFQGSTCARKRRSVSQARLTQHRL